MTMNSKMSQDYMSIRAWLRLAAIGLVAWAILSSLGLYHIAQDVQKHAEQLRQSTRLQSISATLGHDITGAWLNVNSGHHQRTAPALAELKQHRDTIRDVLDMLQTPRDIYPSKANMHDRSDWEGLHNSLSEMIKVAEPMVARSLNAVFDATPATPPTASIDKPVFKNFMNHLKTTISANRFAGTHSYVSARWVLRNLCTMTLAIIALITLCGLFFLIFMSFRIGSRTTDVTNRILQYTSGVAEPPDRGPRNDEFGAIEAKVDHCAQTVYGMQMEVAQEHEKTLKQLKARTEELSKLNDALRASGRALVRFLTDVSHDLRTPLAIMVGESEVSLRSQSTSIDEYKETLSRMLDQTRYLGSLVDQLLYTARSRVSAVPLQPDYIDVPELVGNACRDMKTLAANRDIAIEFNNESARHIVLGDQTRLREMMLTIIDNAIEYSKPDGTIVVSISEKTANLKIAVVDSGIGIPAHEIPMIFRRFYRAENAPDANAQGTGIGLAVAKGIVESHDGTIEIDSQEGKGTTVIVMLPLVDQKKRPQSDQSDATDAPPHGPDVAHLTTA